MRWAVVFLIHVRTPHQHIPKLIIENVPKGEDEYHLKSLLEEAGYTFGEFGIPWANHYISPLRDCPPSVRGAYRRGEVETVDYKELKELEEEDL